MIDPILEDTSRPLTRHRTRASRSPRRRTAFEIWASEPVIVLRVGLFSLYLTTVYFGVTAFIAGIPAFQVAAPRGWTPIWAGAVIVGGALAVVGSVNDRPVFQWLERLGGFLLFLSLGGYAGVLHVLAYATVPGDINRAAVGAGFLALGAFPFVRLMWLMSQVRKKPTPPATKAGEESVG